MIDLFKTFVNEYVMQSSIMVTWCIVLFFVVFWKAETLVKPKVAGFLGLLMIGFFAFSFTDPNFSSIAAKDDNIPILMMLFSTFFFLWLGLYQGVKNDKRIAKGLPPLEVEDTNKKVFTWPDLVFIEFIVSILATVGFFIWGILLRAPLEQPAAPAKSPNPAKAPWYFLGLQEMLVYFDPWLAGVIFPMLIIVGLIAIPYIDKNRKGNGYFTLQERKAEIMIFCFGFYILWVLLIFYGTFLRGPNWDFFGPYEVWDAHKVSALTNWNFSELIYIKALDKPVPGFWLVRELPGLLFIAFYLLVLPVILGKTLFKKYMVKLGAPRFYIAVTLFLFMASLPIKMYLRWIFNLKYIVAIPEYFFNI